MVWLPVTEINNNSVEKHPWCRQCGLVKNISEDFPRGLGYWMNLLSYISDRYNLTQCQKRLMAKDIEASEYLDDTFSTCNSFQKRIFNKIINKYIHVNIDSFIY